MNRKQPPVLFSRTYNTKNGKKSTVYWYYVTDEYGRRLRFSLRTSSKTEAHALLLERIRTGSLIPQRVRATRFDAFSNHFWDWDCSSYLKWKRLRGDRISRHWARQNRGYLENHLLPVFGRKHLSEISPNEIERFMIDLREQKALSNKSINSILGCLKTILGDAQREELIAENPAEKVKPLHNGYRRRGILTVDEAKRLFSAFDYSGYVHYAINLTACTTGARLGELQGLKVKKVRTDQIVIDSVYRRIEGYVEGDTKTGVKGWRIVPVLLYTSKVIYFLITEKDPKDFVFSMNGQRPIAGNTVTRNLHHALQEIGISYKEQRERRIDFHSWRHFYESILRGNVSDSDLRQITGHTSPSMTERYSHRMPERITQYACIQERIFSPLLPEVHIFSQSHVLNVLMKP
jgi:integrase